MAPAPTRPFVRTALLSLVTALTVELVRASGPMFDRAFSAGVVVVALTALGTYVAPGLVALAVARARPVSGRTVLVGVGLLAVLRVAAQATSGVPRYWVTLAGAAVAIGVLVLVVHLVAGDAPRRAAHAVLTGVGLAAAVSAWLGTWDAIWRPGLPGWAPTLVVVAGALVCAWLVRDAPDGPGPCRTWALGPFLAIAVMIAGNPAYLASQLGLELVTATIGLLTGLALASWTLLGAPRRLPAPYATFGPAVLLVASTAAVLLPTQPLGEPAGGPRAALALGAIIVLVVMSAHSLADAWAAPLPARRPVRAGLLRAGAASVAGLGVILPLLVYQLDYDVPLGFPNWVVLLVTAGALAAAGVRRASHEGAAAHDAGAADDAAVPDAATDGDAAGRHGAEDRSGAAAARPAPGRSSRDAHALTAGVVVLGLAGLGVPSSAVAPAQDRPAGTVDVLSWNLHYGVTQEPGLDLGRMADAIVGSGAQVVALQEVSRGWVMGGGADMLTYLERATGFVGVTAPAADRQFVNVLLVDPALGGPTEVVRTRLPYGDGPQWRSAVTATVHVAAEGRSVPLVVTSAHLQHRESNTPTRLAQLDVLMAADIASHPAAVIAGDLNSEPGWPEISYVTDRGYASAQDVAGDPAALTFPAWEPEVRIDWMFGAGVTFSDVKVMPDDGSDHRGILATVGVTGS